MSIPPRLGLVTLGTADFDRMRSYYLELGWPIAVEETDFCLFDTAAGYFADPEGNAWEVAHNPHWALDARGLPVPPTKS